MKSTKKVKNKKKKKKKETSLGVRATFVLAVFLFK